MRKLLEDAGIEDIQCDSAGTMDAHHGDPPDSRMVAAGRRRGLPMTGAARCIEAGDFRKFDLILAMDRTNMEDLKRLAPDNQALRRTRLFCDFCREQTATEVPDPYYGGPNGFELVLDLLEDGCRGLLEAIKNRETHGSGPA